MANTRYKNIIKLFSEITEEEIHLDELKTRIKMFIATRDIIVRDILQDMCSMGFIKENPDKPFWYKINKNGKVL